MVNQRDIVKLGTRPVERIFAWLGAWAFGFSFFLSSSKPFSPALISGRTLMSSFFRFLSEKRHEYWSAASRSKSSIFFFIALWKTMWVRMKHKWVMKSLREWNERKEKNALPLGEALLETLWERMMAIQPSTSTEASFLNSAKNGPNWVNRKKPPESVQADISRLSTWNWALVTGHIQHSTLLFITLAGIQ